MPNRPVESASLGLCHCYTTTVLKLTFVHFYSKGWISLTFHHLTLFASEPTVNYQHCQVRNFHWTRQNWGQLPGGHPAMIHALSVERPACSFARLRGKFPQLSLFSLKRQTPDALPLGWSIILKIIGHLMVHQSITVCRDVSRKPVHSVEQKGFRISARPLQRSTERKLEVKGKDHASKQSRESVEQFISIHATSSYF